MTRRQTATMPNIRIRPRTLERLEAEAKRQGMSAEKMATRVLETYLDAMYLERAAMQVLR